MSRSIRRPPYFASLLATTVVLAVLGALALLAAEGERLRRALSESVTVVVELRPAATEAERADFTVWLASQPFARAGTLRFLSAEEGAERLRRAYGEDFLRAGLANPLFDVYTFNLAAGYTGDADRGRVREAVVAQAAVLAAAVQDDYAARLVARLSSLRVVGIALAGVLLLGTSLLVVNTARLALLSRAVVIRNMELVGASWGFIARPFLVRAAFIGLAGGLLAAGLVYAAHEAGMRLLPALWRPLPLESLLIGGGIVVLSGILLNFATTFFVIRRTLRLRIDDLD